MTIGIRNLTVGILVTVVGGFILALLVSECREIKATHDAVIRLEEKSK